MISDWWNEYILENVAYEKVKDLGSIFKKSIIKDSICVVFYNSFSSSLSILIVNVICKGIQRRLTILSIHFKSFKELNAEL